MVALIIAVILFAISALCYLLLVDHPRARFAGFFLALGLLALTIGQLADKL